MSRDFPQFSLSGRGARRLFVRHLLLGLLSLAPLDLVQGQPSATLSPVPVVGTAFTPSPSPTDSASLQPDDIRATVERLLEFQIPSMGQISLEGTPTTGWAQKRTSSPVGWVHGALLIGLKDWAKASNDTAWWRWLQVLPALHSTHISSTW
jgi:hypothetical protein